MRLAIMLCIYSVISAAGLLLLRGPLKRVLGDGKASRFFGKLIFAVLLVMIAFPVAGGLVPFGPACFFFQKWGNIFIGFFIYFFGCLLIVRTLLLPVHLVHRIRKHSAWKPSRAASSALVFGLLALSVFTNVLGYRTARDVRVTNYTLPKETLGQTESRRIILIGDLHIGVNSGTQLYRDTVDLINEQDADLILIAGDILTSTYEGMGDPEACASILSEMQSSSGNYVVYGNHDVEEPLLGGFSTIGPENAVRHPEMEGFLKKCGWELLTDEVVSLPGWNGLYLAGRRDESRPGDGVRERMPLKELLTGIDPSSPVLLIQHEPSDLEELDSLGIDLSVSGHTHDGQIFPGNIISRMFVPLTYGLESYGKSLALVTSGIGFYGPPIRVGTISEIVVIDLI